MGSVYQIQHKTDLNLMTYIGSTVIFSIRRSCHKSSCTNSNAKNYNYPVYQYIRKHGGWNAWEMTEIYHGEDYLKIEQDLVKDNFDNLLNINMPGRTDAEYKKENREHIREWRKEKVPCPHCDRFICRSALARHMRTQYCINYSAPESTSSSDSASETA